MGEMGTGQQRQGCRPGVGVDRRDENSGEEPHAAQPAEEYEVRTLTARTRTGRDLASFTTRPGWTAGRDARELVLKFKDLIHKAEKTSAK